MGIRTETITSGAGTDGGRPVLFRSVSIDICFRPFDVEEVNTNRIDLTGKTFGKLTVLSYAGTMKDRALWNCRCECGKVKVKIGKYLKNGDTRSCGCMQQWHRATGNRKYGIGKGKMRRREYTIWRSMKSRCYTKSSSNYRFYGAKGVTVCDRWRDNFLAFLEDMGPVPTDFTLDRIDPAGNYEPSNCRWASWDLQHRNLRRHAMRPSSFSQPSAL